MSANLIIQETPILVSPTLAKRIGLNEAIFLQQLHYWLNKSSHVYEGKKWIYNSYENWQNQLPFWSIATIKRIIAKLKRLELIFIRNFNESKFDKTNWYSINYEHHLLSSDDLSQREGQNDPRSRSSCTNLDRVNLTQPIPETTTEITREKETFSKEKVCPTSDEVDSPPSSANVPYKKILELWNQKVIENRSVLPKIIAIKPKTQRCRFVRARWKDFPDLKIWEQIFDKATRSSFLNGDNKRGFMASFDWIVKSPSNFLKVLEGNYDDQIDPYEEIYQEFGDSEYDGTKGVTWQDLEEFGNATVEAVARNLEIRALAFRTVPLEILQKAREIIKKQKKEANHA